MFCCAGGSTLSVCGTVAFGFLPPVYEPNCGYEHVCDCRNRHVAYGCAYVFDEELVCKKRRGVNCH